ncbi:hypothetical protein [Proteiniclasticum sp. QWL-01]|uniref:hypothetical protein n=1 Tax=Proteiniclasticum sp. QWL-01 TaxID=3036945 RepID=UPI0024115E33|nr:hypothetical protein [Proteiniclasticum sp. QWL-01]WFF74359.1 hypothetical protein P6M73_07885 [Proteiniclasticum sp. QWL-01]
MEKRKHVLRGLTSSLVMALALQVMPVSLFSHSAMAQTTSSVFNPPVVETSLPQKSI